MAISSCSICTLLKQLGFPLFLCLKHQLLLGGHDFHLPFYLLCAPLSYKIKKDSNVFGKFALWIKRMFNCYCTIQCKNEGSIIISTIVILFLRNLPSLYQTKPYKRKLEVYENIYILKEGTLSLCFIIVKFHLKYLSPFTMTTLCSM